MEKALRLPNGAVTPDGFIYRENIHETQEWIIATVRSLGTVPYQAWKVNGKVQELTWELCQDTLIEQSRLDYFTIHAGIRRHNVHLADKRLCGIVSRGGSIA